MFYLFLVYLLIVIVKVKAVVYTIRKKDNTMIAYMQDNLNRRKYDFEIDRTCPPFNLAHSFCYKYAYGNYPNLHHFTWNPVNYCVENICPRASLVKDEECLWNNFYKCTQYADLTIHSLPNNKERKLENAMSLVKECLYLNCNMENSLQAYRPPLIANLAIEACIKRNRVPHCACVEMYENRDKKMEHLEEEQKKEENEQKVSLMLK
jgi:hypothetical protein